MWKLSGRNEVVQRPKICGLGIRIDACVESEAEKPFPNLEPPASSIGVGTVFEKKGYHSAFQNESSLCAESLAHKRQPRRLKILLVTVSKVHFNFISAAAALQRSARQIQHFQPRHIEWRIDRPAPVAFQQQESQDGLIQTIQEVTVRCELSVHYFLTKESLTVGFFKCNRALGLAHTK